MTPLRQTRVSVSGYITVFPVSVAAFSAEQEHFFTCFRQISVSVAELTATPQLTSAGGGVCSLFYTMWFWVFVSGGVVEVCLSSYC